MIQYITAREAAEKWNISQRRVSVLCSENRIPGVAMIGNMWIIPRNAEKPTDARKEKQPKRTESVHPFVKWAGGKSQLVDVLKMNLPENMETEIKKYAEPFVGGGAFLFELINKYKFEEIYINDNNKELINVYNAVKDRCNILIVNIKSLEATYNDLSDEEQQAFYYEKREHFNNLPLTEESSVEKAALFVFLNKTCFNGIYRVNKKGKFNVPFGKRKNVNLCDVENLHKTSELLQNVIIRSFDYHDVLCFADSSTLVYFDPPYRPLNSTSSFTSYTENDFSDEDQERLSILFKELSSRGTKVMLSNSDPKNVNENDNFFDELYKGFNIVRVDASRAINSIGSKRGKIKELLIKNY
ncbi:MAG: Dam family site-specific DNA-(adenine-N6)-methyltransferase [Clostridia bacterium]|nr:Dam family site-specific DNA-(adenine-N6)-methyltransferase [Clostridia bacterium]